MNLIVCISNDNGVAFNKRRQSRDCIVSQHIVELAAGTMLQMTPYSATLFNDIDLRPTCTVLVATEDPIESAFDDDYVFIDADFPTDFNFIDFDAVEKVIVFRWNRDYPSDRFFDIEQLLNGWVIESTTEFEGNSHELITQEVYVKA